MRVSLKTKFALYISLIILFILGLVATYVVQSRSQEIESSLISADQTVSVSLSGELSEYLADFYFLQFETFAELTKKLFSRFPDLVYFRIFTPEGKVLFDFSEFAQGKYEKSDERIIADEVLLDKIAAEEPSHDFVEFEGKRSIRVVAPYVDKYGNRKSSVEFIFSLERERQEVTKAITSLVILFGVFIVVGVLVSFVFAGRIIKPILDLKKGAEAVSKGNLDQQVVVKTKDELQDLADSFNKMVAEVKTSRGKLEEYSRTLEQQVLDRTKELAVRINDLERLQKITINRELKMIEMKQEIERLKRTAS